MKTSRNSQRKQTAHKIFYIPVQATFWLSHSFAVCWIIFVVYLSLPWIEDLDRVVTQPAAVLIIGGIAYVPGCMNGFLVISLIIDRQPGFKKRDYSVCLRPFSWSVEKGTAGALTFTILYNSRFKSGGCPISVKETDRPPYRWDGLFLLRDDPA
ncbi:hypothetical protein [Salibacterium lacus]|uniref:Uncharacterized protein n=1 Tax=Salibacterium lacus TaxID=1898109 RepID=A0ABW5T6I9_9BACI